MPPKPRRKSEKSAEIVERDESDHSEEDGGVQHETENAGQGSLPDLLESHTIILLQQPPDIENEEFIPDPNILSGPVEHQTPATQPLDTNTSNYYQESHSGIGFPQISSAPPAAGSTTMAGLTYPHAETNENAVQPAVGVAFPSTSLHHQSSHGVPVLQSPSASTAHQQTQSSPSSRRKSLPTSQSKQTPIPPPIIPVHTSNWSSSSSIHHPPATSPKMAHHQAVKRPKPRKSRAEPEQQGHDSLKQAAPQSTQYQSPMTRSPYQSAAQVNPRQGHRSQTNTPAAPNPRPPPQAPSTTTHQPTTSAPSYSASTTSGSVSNYNPYARYNNNNGNAQYNDAGNDHNSSRIAYESSSYQSTPTTTTSSSYSSNPSIPSYDYGRASGAANPLSQALNSAAAYGGTAGATANKWPTSQTRGGQNDNSSSAYSLPASNTSTSHGYGTRSSDARASTQNPPYNQPQSQNYSSYPSQQSSLNQQNQQNWYGFTAANNSNQASYANNRQTSHGSHRSNAPPYSSQYSGHDEQTLYDLLRTGSSNH